MFFKTLEIQGFKSFADKTVLNFDTQTTAVVGSNGNGKSNISDALLWVMGEQGAKTLRGEKMEDVIFHGTVERKPMGFARVALTIDNKDRTLKLDADEVVISRKLYRSGESEYMINGQKCRLKDIQELLMGTGLGRDGYSIIGQNRVRDIVNARPVQRREFFEEAAGVSLSLHQKQSAEKNLAAAEDNITRLRDILSVYEERLPTLQKQSEKAILFTELQAHRKELEISVSVAKLSEQRSAMGKLADELLRNRAECDNFESDISRAQEQIDELSDEKLSANASLEHLRRGKEAANAEIAALRTEIEVAENDLKHNETRRAELSEQIKTAEQGSRGFDEQIEQLSALIAKHEETAAALDEQRTAAQQELSSLSEKSGEAQREFSELETQLAELYRKKTAAAIAVSQAEYTESEVEEQKRVFLLGLSDGETKRREYTEEKEQAEKLLSENAEKLDTQKNRLAGYARISEGKRRRLDEAKSALDKVNAQLIEKQQRHKVLSDLEKNMVGYSNAVKAVMTASEQNRLHGIHGIVADIISVEQRYVQAIETVLQGTMQNIIVDDGETATRCINFLKETGAGRATFYPINTMRGRVLSERGVENEDGVEGVASELIQCADFYKEIVRNLLGTTVVVDDMSTANRISKKYGYKFRVVTLDGQLINAGGSYTGGSAANRNKMLSQKQEIEALYAEITQLRQEAREKNESFEQYRAEIAKADIELEGMNDEIRALEAEEIRIRADIARLDGLIEQLSQQGETARLTLERFDAQIAQQQSIIAENKQTEEATAALISEHEQKRDSTGSSRRELDEKLKMLSEQIQSISMERLAALKDAEARRTEIKSVKENRRIALENSSEFREKLLQLDNSDREIREKIERLKLSVEGGSERINEKDDEIKALLKLVEDCERKISEAHSAISEASGHKEKFSREVARLEERQASMQKDYDSIVDMLYKSYELTVSEATAQAKPPENLMAAENELDDLKKQISALGTVNTAAIEEYREISAVYKEQSEQLADVEGSKRDLERLIVQLTADIRTRFLASFNEINEHFKEIFVEIFGEGAHAELELTDPDDVLNSGIEISAAPPGKVIKNLISLSGGEQTMVAITIFLAILRHRPSPFCMMDEVDAALDDINVEKYISYLNKFSSRTQLMVITHRRGTIEACKVLYGVFMQEKGVSRLLRRELTDDLDVELS